MMKKSPINEFNIGGGYRWLNADSSHLYGAYGFYDRKTSVNNFSYDQITLGGEFKTQQWLMGGNVYIPMGTTKNTFNVKSSGGSDIILNDDGSFNVGVFSQNDFEVAYAGADVWWGQHDFLKTKGLNLTVGGFYFTHADYTDIVGPRVSADYDMLQFMSHKPSWLDQLSLTATVQHDTVRETRFYAGVKLTIPLGNMKTRRNLTGLEREMTAFVNRDIDIVTVQNKPGDEEISQQMAKNANGKLISGRIAKTTGDLVFDCIDSSIDICVIGKDMTFQGINGAGTQSIGLSPGKTLTGGSFTYTDDKGVVHTVDLSEHVEGEGNPTITYDPKPAVNGVKTGVVVRLSQDNTVRDLDIDITGGANNVAAITNTEPYKALVIQDDGTVDRGGKFVGDVTIANMNIDGGYIKINGAPPTAADLAGGLDASISVGYSWAIADSTIDTNIAANESCSVDAANGCGFSAAVVTLTVPEMTDSGINLGALISISDTDTTTNTAMDKIDFTGGFEVLTMGALDVVAAGTADTVVVSGGLALGSFSGTNDACTETGPVDCESSLHGASVSGATLTVSGTTVTAAYDPDADGNGNANGIHATGASLAAGVMSLDGLTITATAAAGTSGADVTGMRVTTSSGSTGEGLSTIIAGNTINATNAGLDATDSAAGMTYTMDVGAVSATVDMSNSDIDVDSMNSDALGVSFAVNDDLSLSFGYDVDFTVKSENSSATGMTIGCAGETGSECEAETISISTAIDGMTFNVVSGSDRDTDTTTGADVDGVTISIALAFDHLSPSSGAPAEGEAGMVFNVTGPNAIGILYTLPAGAAVPSNLAGMAFNVTSTVGPKAIGIQIFDSLNTEIDHVYTPVSVVVSHTPTTGNALATGFSCNVPNGSCSFKPTGELTVTATATATATGSAATGIDVPSAKTATINGLSDFTVTATSAENIEASATGIKLAVDEFIMGSVEIASVTNNAITLSCGTGDTKSCFGVRTGLDGSSSGRDAPFVGKLTFTGNTITVDSKAKSKGIEMFITVLDMQEGTSPNFFGQFILTNNALKCVISGTEACEAASATIFIRDREAGTGSTGNRNVNDRAYRNYLSNTAQANTISAGGEKVIIEGNAGTPIDE